MRIIQFNLYWKFICTDENNDKNKKELPPPLSSTPIAVFLIAEKLLTLWLWNFKTFSFFLLPFLWKLERNCIPGLFFIFLYLSEIEKNSCFNYLVFNSLQAKVK